MQISNKSFSSSARIATASVLCLLFIVVMSCNFGPPENSLYKQSLRGQEHFKLYCSQCHGEDGRGLAIDTLVTQPADLTRIVAKRTSSEFPVQEIAEFIDGRRAVKAHGPRAMPVWGEVFATEEHLDQDKIRGKLGEIIAYLMSIQRS